MQHLQLSQAEGLGWAGPGRWHLGTGSIAYCTPGNLTYLPSPEITWPVPSFLCKSMLPAGQEDQHPQL